MKVEGVKELIAALKERNKRWLEESNISASRNKGWSVVVGFTATYALYVHENMEMKLKGLPRPKGRGLYWDPQGIAGPKFLEGPARELSNSGELSRIFTSVLKAGRTVLQALLACGLRIQREAQKRVPVDTGVLKASAFTRVE